MGVTLDELIGRPPFSVGQPEKDAALGELLDELHGHHLSRCPEYRSLMASGAFPKPRGTGLASLPFMPVRMFKRHRLASVSDDEIQKVLMSSGTSGQLSQIYLDGYTASLQARALAAIVTEVIGPARLPMLVIDTPGSVGDRKSFSARGAGIRGMLNFGRKPRYALDEGMGLNRTEVMTFLAEHGDAPFLMFGFTFMVWQYFYRPLIDAGLDLSNGILIHSGGWKKLEEIAVSNEVFKDSLRTELGLARVYNFYGMVEQVGSVFLEGNDGTLHCPSFAEVIVRDPHDWSVCEPGQPGVIEVLSALPRSYPGHVLLTEDIGVAFDEGPSNGWHGRRFRVHRRLPNSELRGCSDTHARAAGALA